MRVGCPHCHAAYNLDDRRVPATGLNVRCPKCRETFPVRPAAADARGHAVEGERVPLPGGVAPVERAVPLAPPPPVPASHGGVPLPAPRATAGGVPLPPPDLVTSPGVPLPPPVPAATGGHGDPFAPAAQAQDPFGADVPDATDDAIEETPGGGLGLGEVTLGAGAPAAAEPAPPSLDDTDPFAPAPGSADPFTAPPAAPAASAPPAPVPTPPSGGDDLEMLFGEGARARPDEVRYRVRLPSGKVVGPFDAGRVMELLSRGELAGTEEVSRDGEDDWTPIGEAEPFADAVARDGGGRRRGARLSRIGRGASRRRPTAPRRRRVARDRARGRGRRWVHAARLRLAGAARAGHDAYRGARREGARGAREGRLRGGRARSSPRAVAADPDAREAAALHAIAVARSSCGTALRRQRSTGAARGGSARGRRRRRRALGLPSSSRQAVEPRRAGRARARRGEGEREGRGLVALSRARRRAATPRPRRRGSSARRVEPKARARAGGARRDRPRRPCRREDRARGRSARCRPSAGAARARGARGGCRRRGGGGGGAGTAPREGGGGSARPPAGPNARAPGGALARSAAGAADADRAWEAAAAADRARRTPVALARHRLAHGDAAGAVAATNHRRVGGRISARGGAVRALAGAGVRSTPVARGSTSRPPADAALARRRARSRRGADRDAATPLQRRREAGGVGAAPRARPHRPHAAAARRRGRGARGGRRARAAHQGRARGGRRAPARAGDAAGAEGAYRQALAVEPECAAAR
jgi:predicted Zn finger-like uncharacterized protein